MATDTQHGDRDYGEYLKRLTTFESPPAGFDPQRAEERHLVLHGYPRRPSSERQRDLRGLWDKAFLRPHRLVRAELEIDRALLDRPHPIVELNRKGEFAPSGWGGIVAATADFGFSPPEQANVVYGEWTVPTMQPDFDHPTTPMTVGFWVGLDGFGNNQVLQAGTAATVTGSTIDYWAWFEWYPDPPVKIMNFPINPGELVTVTVCAPQTNQGFVSMLNRTTGVTTSAGIPPPAAMTSAGATAEWIVEGISSDLPNFGSIAFLNCTAGTKTHTIDLSHPTPTAIVGASGADLTSASILPTIPVPGVPATSVLVIWEAIS